MISPHKQKQLFIEKMVTGGKINWPREMKLANRLFGYFPENIDFLSGLSKPFSMTTLAWFFTDKGKEYIKKKFLIYKKEGKYKPSIKSVEVGEEDRKVGKDAVNKFSKRKLMTRFIKGLDKFLDE